MVIRWKFKGLLGVWNTGLVEGIDADVCEIFLCLRNDIFNPNSLVDSLVFAEI